MICAACGMTRESLKLCAACKAVRYCNVNCQKKHRRDHRSECTQRASELKIQEITSRLELLSISNQARLGDSSSDLWKSPQRQECPICMLMLPLDVTELVYNACCGKTVCGGCNMKRKETIEENNIARLGKVPLVETCAFCREPAPSCTEEALECLKKRMGLNDAKAWLCMAGHCSEGSGVPKDERKELECIVRAAELGSPNAFHRLATHYRTGQLIEPDEGKYEEYLRMATMGGNVEARHNLGMLENRNCRADLAVRHWQISAGAGVEESLHNIKAAYKCGLASKDVLAETLRAYQAAQEELKSEARDVYSKERGVF